MLGKHGLKVSFSPHALFEPFDISLADKNTSAVVVKAPFQYSYGKYLDRLRNEPGIKYKGPNKHDMRELIEAINGMIEKRGLVLVDADEGADSFVFVLFETKELAKLEEKYGNVRELVNLDKVIRCLRNIP